MLAKLDHIDKTYSCMPILYATLASVTIVLMQLSMKLVTHYLSTYYVLFLRGVLLLLVNTFVVRSAGFDVSQPNPVTHRLLLKRAVAASLALTTFMFSVAYIPIGIANSMFNTGPIFIYFLEAYFEGKKLNTTHLMLTMVCFVGVLFIIKPGFLFGHDPQNDTPVILVILPLVGALGNSFSQMFTHQLKTRVSNLITLQYFYIVQTFVTTLLQNFQQMRLKIPIDGKFFLLVGCMVGFAYVTQNFVTRAMYLRKASYVMPFGYISILVAFILDVMVFNESFDLLSIFGTVLTSVGLLGKILLQD